MGKMLKKDAETKNPKPTVESKENIIKTVNIFSAYSIDQEDGVTAEIVFVDGVISEISISESCQHERVRLVIANSYKSDALIGLFEKIVEQCRA